MGKWGCGGEYAWRRGRGPGATNWRGSTMGRTAEQVVESVQEVVVGALGVGDEEVTRQAKLVADLGAESIDFLDIVFRLEKAFSTPDQPFKIEPGELFPDNLLENPEWVDDGKFTDKGMDMLKESMPHVDFAAFDADRSVDKVAATITVTSIVDFVQRKLEKA